MATSGASPAAQEEGINDIIKNFFIDSLVPETVLPVIQNYDPTILKSEDIEEVRQVSREHGDQKGAEELLKRLTLDSRGYSCLLQVLRDPQVNQPQVADLVQDSVAYASGNQSVEVHSQTNVSGATKKEMIKNINLLLIGKTGCGKSATGNSILFKTAFQSSQAMTSVTRNIEYDYSENDGCQTKVVDMPGVGDTRIKPRDNIQTLVKALSTSVATTPEGYHAVLLVMRSDERFTKEDVQSIEQLKCIFGEQFIRNHVILLLTHGDTFKPEVTFDEWCKEQVGEFAELYRECGQRAVIFDNVTVLEDIRNKQVRCLFHKINSLLASGPRYDSMVFQISRGIHCLSVTLHGKVISEDIVREIGNTTHQLTYISLSKPENEKERLEKIKRRLEKLKDVITEEHSEIGKQESLKLLAYMEVIVQEQENAVEIYFEKKQENEQKFKEEKLKFMEQWREEMAKEDSEAGNMDSPEAEFDHVQRKTNAVKEKWDEIKQELHKETKAKWRQHTERVVTQYQEYKAQMITTAVFRYISSQLGKVFTLQGLKCVRVI